jgi:glycosyltransferase involved in cell wall biosynthesis
MCGGVVKLVVCWSDISGYMAACWRAFAEIEGVDLFVVARKPQDVGSMAPFADNLMMGLNYRFISDDETVDPTMVASLVESLNPDVIMIAGWFLPAYVRLALSPHLADKRFIMTMDTAYRGSLRQRLAPVKLASFLRRIHRVLVPGERAWQMASRMGFAEAQICRGMLGYDSKSLSPVYERRLSQGPWPRRFVFMARYAKEKGIEDLLEAYRIYRGKSKDPWSLECCGAGPMREKIRAAVGVSDRGFVQPTNQPDVWLNSGAFVLSSRREPWGVAVLEAAAAGLPLLCTEACGAAAELVRWPYNGKTVATSNPESLAAGMSWIEQNYHNVPEMGRHSKELAEAYTAEMWGQRIHLICTELMQAG